MGDRIITPRTVRKPTPGTDAGVLTRVPFVAIDVETTGVSADSRVIEIAAVKMNHRGEVLDEFASLINPGYGVPLNPQAQKIHGITPNMVWSAPPADEVYPALAEFIGPLGVVAHNLDFENRFLTSEYGLLDIKPAWQGICTLAAARASLVAPNYRLATLLELLELPAVNSHRAAADAHACGLLLATIIDQCGTSDLQPLNTPAPAPATGRAPRGRASQPSASQRVADLPATPITAGQITKAMGGFPPTEEQSAVIDAFHTGDDLLIAALAGTGKTSTVLGLARLEHDRRPDRGGRYLAFNRSVADEAKTKFPPSVQVSTAHALAVRELRSTPRGPLLAKLSGGRSTFREMGDLIGTTPIVVPGIDDRPRRFANYPVTRMALQTVEKFCITMDPDITADHVPVQLGVSDEGQAELADHIVPLARRAWTAICDPHTWTIRLTPGHVLKLWADTHPRIGRDGDYLIFDEAQDANPLMASIVNDQTHLQRIRVGDSNQAINRFTGAVDAMRKVTGATELPLTKSWRFGPAIADAANYYLAELGSTMRVRGNEAINAHLLTGGDVDAVLCRTNAAAIAEVITAQQRGHKTALIGDITAGVRFCESAEQLQAGQQPEDADLAAFTTWAELQEYVENMPGVADVKTLVELVDTYTLPVVQSALKSVVPPHKATLVASTAHKAKGLEYERVRIHQEWELNPDDYTDLDELADERMLAYVGLTRAKRGLDPGPLLDSATVARISRRHHPDGAPLPDTAVPALF